MSSPATAATVRGRGLLLALGATALFVALASVADLLRPKPWDGVVLESDVPGLVEVRRVIEGSGGDAAGIAAGDRIVGIDRTILNSVTHAAELLGRHEVGDRVPYLLRSSSGLREAEVELGPRGIASLSYLATSALGFAFFLVGLFVLRAQPDLRAARVFFLLSVLFLLFLVCRLRPASYSWVDAWVLGAGTLGLLGLPPAFLHFFVLFPRPVYLWSHEGWRRRRHLLLAAMYLAPAVVLLLTVLHAWARRETVALISGAPAANWWVLAVSMLAGILLLRQSAARLEDPRERSGATLVLLGTVFGVLPFLVLAVAFPSFLRTERYLLYGTLPLALVPLTFAYAIVRFGILDIRVLLRRSLLYTLTTAALTAFYALGIGLVQSLYGEAGFTRATSFPIVYAIGVVLLFEPVRRRLQVSIDALFQQEETRLRQALVDMGTAFAEELDLEAVVRDLVEKLPKILGVQFAALYLMKDGLLERRHGPASLPSRLEMPEELREFLSGRLGAVRLEELGGLAASSSAVRDLRASLQRSGVEVLADLATSRRLVGLVLLSGKSGRMAWEQGELELLEGLLHQAAMALETSLLLEERTRQVELERDVEIAARVQAALLPATLHLGPGWVVAATCRPARHVGGDFYTALPGAEGGEGAAPRGAVVFGDVAGKSVSAALLMMAAHEILHTLAMTHTDPEELIALANQRLYSLGPRKSFVALCYLVPGEGDELRYILAGQPQPLLRRLDGEVMELPLPDHRIPLGALGVGTHRALHVTMKPQEILLGYSDGVLDARSPAGESFGFERLQDVVGASPTDPRQLVDGVLRALDDFTRGAEPYDDVTLVAVARSGVAASQEGPP